jgi:hypothetical protein
MDKVQTPLLLLSAGVGSTFEDWPYEVLRYLKRPVDLIMVQANSHVMINPVQRLAAETRERGLVSLMAQGRRRPRPC